MKDLTLLMEKLKILAADREGEDTLKKVVHEIARFYAENFGLEEDEVAILLTDKDKVVLSFAYPHYLVNAGMIPVISPDAFASFIYKMNKGIIENHFGRKKHLHLFEYVKTPDNQIKPISKMMGTILQVGGEKFGVIEISRKSISPNENIDDFLPENLEFLEKSLTHLAPILKKVMPEDFRGKLT